MELDAELRNLVARWAAVAHSDSPEGAREVLAAKDVREACERVYLEAGAQAHDTGLSWAALAGALGLAGGGSAHFLFGPGRDGRLARHRKRAEHRVAHVAAGPSVPGVKVAEAAARLGVSATTLRRRIEAGEIRATTVMSPGGRTRLVVDERDLPPTGA